MAFTYILFSPSANRHYTGSCDILDKRFDRHNAGYVPSTKYGIPWQLIWSRELPTRSQARKLEKNIKKRGAKRFLQDLTSNQ